MRILMSGGAGFLGQGMAEAFGGDHQVRLMDVVAPSSPCDYIVGDVTKYDDCRKAMDGMDALIVAHMAPRGKGLYQTPEVPFNVNVLGTANLYAAALESGVSRVVLISSTTVVQRAISQKQFLTRDMPFAAPADPYPLTKVCQETIAREYHDAADVSTAVLRPAYVTDAERMHDKYGRTFDTPNWQYIDRRDIGQAARKALELPDLGFEVFYVLGHPDAETRADVAYTRARLGWQPQYPFV